MAKFAYVATDPVGGTVQGTQKADSREAAEIALFERELREIRVTEKVGLLQKDVTSPKVKREEVMHMSRQLAAFIRAGLPLLDAISTLGEDASNKAVKKMMVTIEELLRRGETLSDCVDRYPKVFPDYYRGILRSAELTGQLDTVLDQLASYLERDLEARRKIKAASIYPGIILLMSVGTVVVLAAFVLPRFKVFFESLDAELPLPTRMLLAVTDFFGEWWWAIVIGLAAATAVFLLALRTDSGRHLWNKITLHLPVIGEAVQYALVERFCRLMSSMIGAGVNLTEALTVSSASLRNLVYNRALVLVGEQMLEGEGIAKPLADSKLFPSTAAQMIRVGEETGTLDTQLEVAARYYERELDYKIKRVTALFEPVVIIAMGLVVGFVALALVSAMYGVFNQVKM